MSVAFTKEESAETASETQLPDRSISTHPNWVTERGLRLLQEQLEHTKVAGLEVTYDGGDQAFVWNGRRFVSWDA